MSENDSAQVSIGTLIILIAMVLVAVVAILVLIQTTYSPMGYYERESILIIDSVEDVWVSSIVGREIVAGNITSLEIGTIGKSESIISVKINEIERHFISWGNDLIIVGVEEGLPPRTPVRIDIKFDNQLVIREFYTPYYGQKELIFIWPQTE